MSFKISDEYGAKTLMKKVLYEMVPQTIFERPKRGFSIPLDTLLATELKPMLDQYLSKQKIEYAGLVDYHVLEKIIKEYLAGKSYYYNRVWVLLVLHWWYFEKNRQG